MEKSDQQLVNASKYWERVLDYENIAHIFLTCYVIWERNNKQSPVSHEEITSHNGCDITNVKA